MEDDARLTELLAPIHDRARASARRLCRSNAEGDDLFHEAVLRAFDKLPELREVERFPAWFYAVLVSVHRARHRRSFWRRFLPEGAAPEPSFVPEDRVDGVQRITAALATLSPEAREAIVLFELDGFTIEEVAAFQAESVAAVKSRLSRARARLRRHYERLERQQALALEVPNETR